MALPYPNLDAVPFTPLTAEFIDNMNENITSLAAGTGMNTGILKPDHLSKTWPMFSAATSSWSNLSDSSSELVKYTTVNYDTVGMYDSSTYKAKVPTTGVYHIDARCAIASAGLGLSGTALIFLHKNEAQFKESQRINGSGTDAVRPNPIISVDVLLQKDDVIDVRARCTEGRNYGGPETLSEFSMRLVGETS